MKALTYLSLLVLAAMAPLCPLVRAEDTGKNPDAPIEPGKPDLTMDEHLRRE